MSAGLSPTQIRRTLQRPEYMLVIGCYFDDSGKEGQQDHRHVVLAGYIGPDDAWWQFHQGWRHLLLRHGIPSVHMKSWLHIAEEKGWNKTQRNEALIEFIDLINRCKLIGFGVAVDADVWRALPVARRKAFGDAQEFCFQRILRRVIDRIDASELNDSITLVFDQDFQFARPRLRLLEHLYNVDRRIRDRVAQICFSSSRAYYQLQAADILAWHTRRQLYAMEKQEPALASWKAMFTELPYVDLFYEGEFWDQKMVEENFAALERELRETGKIAIGGVSFPAGGSRS